MKVFILQWYGPFHDLDSIRKFESDHGNDTYLYIFRGKKKNALRVNFKTCTGRLDKDPGLFSLCLGLFFIGFLFYWRGFCRLPAQTDRQNIFSLLKKILSWFRLNSTPTAPLLLEASA